MIKNGRWKIFLVILAVLVVAAIVARRGGKTSGEVVYEIKPAIGNIQVAITSTATVQPQNRLEIKPPINGRIEKILVKEGEAVKAGQVIAWMSSTERAALLDAARANGPEELKYWETAYKPTPLIAPIDGEVIVSTNQPGQTVTSSDVVIVLSDHLIVQAQVDETDVSKVAVGQAALISLDAYPDIKVKGKVDHIYYESQLVNNVTIYKVDILPETVPPVFRSGMTATVDIVEAARENVLLIPIEAIKRDDKGSFVLLSRGMAKPPLERRVERGISDDKNVEIVSGISEQDRILVTTQEYALPSAPKTGTNPFMPSRRRAPGGK